MTTTVDQVTQRRRGVGLIAHDPAASAGGYTLIAPQTADGHVYLVGMDGEVGTGTPCRAITTSSHDEGSSTPSIVAAAHSPSAQTRRTSAGTSRTASVRRSRSMRSNRP